MVIIGLTGGIATGKSTVSVYLKEKDFEVIDADAIVHQLQRKGEPLYEILVKEFGEKILDPVSKELDRKALSAMAFGDFRMLYRISAIQELTIRKAILTELFKYRGTNKTVFLDCALLFDQKYNALCHTVWTVECGNEVQLQRLMARNNITREEAWDRVRSQLHFWSCNALADKFIHNNGTEEELRKQVDALIADL